MRLLEQFVEKPRACSYLSGQSACLDVRVMLDVDSSELDRMLERGWRRFGPIYFRPACTACEECVSLRVVVESFTPTKSQRRAARACSRFRRVVGEPNVDPARLALYAKWHEGREKARGWDANPQTRDRYELEFAFPHPCAREVAYYDDDRGGQLIALGLFDVTPRALSAAFFFYDPDYAHHSLGTGNVLALLHDARAGGKPYVYLGYRVDGCPSLRYKGAFAPHERLVNRPESLESLADWRLCDQC